MWGLRENIGVEGVVIDEIQEREHGLKCDVVVYRINSLYYQHFLQHSSMPTRSI